MTAAVSIRDLGKVYHLSHQAARHGSFRDALTAMALAPFRRFRELRGTSASLEEFWALHDVSFDVEEGEVIGIVGRNGAGKSTLLKILSRIVEPTKGEARIRGRVASLLEVGTGFHPELSGRENIYLNGSILGMRKSEIDAKFDDIVAFAEVERFLDTPVKRYSSGMYVRLAFGVAAHLEPEVLIIDEVLAVGDAEFQKRCLGKMKEMSTGGGRTVLFVSHNMAAVRSLCSRGVLLRQGRVESIGRADEIVDAYLVPDASDRPSTRTFKRPDDARVWMESATLIVDGQPGAIAPMGSSFGITIRFGAAIPLRMPYLGYVLQTAAGDRLLNGNNRYQPTAGFDHSVSSGIIECGLGIPPLMPGQYVVSLWLGDASQDHHVELDSLSFEITEHDIWDSGQTPPKVTFMWWPTTFQMKSTDRVVEVARVE